MTTTQDTSGSTADASTTRQDPPLTPLYKMSRIVNDTQLSGGVPNASWDQLVSFNQYNVLQVRSFRREKDSKNLEKLTAKFNSRYEKFEHLSSFVKDAKICAIQRGQDTITYLPREDKVNTDIGTIDSSAQH